MREIDPAAARAAVYGGLVFGAGGGGLEAGLASAERTLALGPVLLADLEELEDEAGVVVSTGVGAPGAPTTGAHSSSAGDSIRCLELLHAHGPVAGIMSSHPGAWIAGSWLPVALRRDLVAVDCATNGRGHPLVKMGGMGLEVRPDTPVRQVAAGGHPYREVQVVASLNAGANVLRQVARDAGGMIAAARGPFRADFVREHGAMGAVSACIRLGEAMQAAHDEGPEAVIAAVTTTFGGREIGRGPIVSTDVAFEGAFDVGTIRMDAQGSALDVAVVNEFMAADLDGERRATFPDLIVTLDPSDGMPTAAAAMAPGQEVVVVAVPAARIPIGSGVRDRQVYEELERMLDVPMVEAALGVLAP